MHLLLQMLGSIADLHRTIGATFLGANRAQDTI